MSHGIGLRFKSSVVLHVGSESSVEQKEQNSSVIPSSIVIIVVRTFKNLIVSPWYAATLSFISFAKSGIWVDVTFPCSCSWVGMHVLSLFRVLSIGGRCLLVLVSVCEDILEDTKLLSDRTRTALGLDPTSLRSDEIGESMRYTTRVERFVVPMP